MHSYSIRAIFKLTIDPFSTSRNTFIARNSDNQHSFALISEVVDSKPPRLNKLRPALILTLAMLIIVAIGPALFPEQNMQSLLGKCSYRPDRVALVIHAQTSYPIFASLCVQTGNNCQSVVLWYHSYLCVWEYYHNKSAETP